MIVKSGRPDITMLFGKTLGTLDGRSGTMSHSPEFKDVDYRQVIVLHQGGEDRQIGDDEPSGS